MQKLKVCRSALMAAMVIMGGMALADPGVSIGGDVVGPEVAQATVSVTFDSCGGTAGEPSRSYPYGATYGDLPSASWAGHVFLGWHTGRDGGARIVGTTPVPSDATVLYAHWAEEDAVRVENLTAQQRYPWNGKVDLRFDLNGVPAKEFASLAFKVNDLDLASFDGAAPTNLVSGSHRVVWNADVDCPGVCRTNLVLSATVAIDVPDAPAHGQAVDDQTEKKIVLSWDEARGASFYEIWRGESDVFANAVRVEARCQTPGWSDPNCRNATTYWYWIKSGSSGGVSESGLSLSARRVDPVPTTLTISGDSTVGAGNVATYAARVTYDNGRSGDVSPQWSVDAAFGTISADGVFTAKKTSTDLTATVRAEYSEGGVTVTAEKSVSVLAKYVTVTFDAVGGTPDGESRVYAVYGTYGTLPAAPVRTGYVPAVWYDAREGGTLVTSGSTVPEADATLYAHWTPIAYRLAFDANGGGGSMAALDMTYGTPMMVPDNAFTHPGHTFAGWATGPDAPVTFAPGQSVSNLTTTAGATVTLYARWTPIGYTIAFDRNGGTGTMPSLAMTYGVAERLTANAFARAGCGFTGWALTSDGEVVYGDCQSVSNLTTTADATVTLYARWTAALGPTTGVSATRGSSRDAVTVSWQAVSGATEYHVYRSASNNSSTSTKIGTSTTTSYQDSKGLSPGKDYYYWVKAYSSSSASYGEFGGPATGALRIGTPSGLALGVGEYWNLLAWRGVSNARYYKIYWCLVPGVPIYAGKTSGSECVYYDWIYHGGNIVYGVSAVGENGLEGDTFWWGFP